MSAVVELRQLPAYMPTSPALSKRGELNAEVDFDPYRAANFAQLLESWMSPSVALNNLNQAMGQPDLASGLRLGPVGPGSGTDNHAINVGLRMSW
jgi:hypothetical protein